MKKLLRNFIALVVLAAVAGAVAYAFMHDTSALPASKAPVVQPAAKKVPESKPLEFSQIMNATVPDLSADDGTTFTLKDGQYSGAHSEAELDTKVGAHALGDLNGDGSSELAAVIGESGGGTGYFAYLEIFTSVSGQPKFIASAFLGDRVTINKISIAGGTVTADIITQGPGEPMCCGTMRKVTSYRISGTKLVEVK